MRQKLVYTITLFLVPMFLLAQTRFVASSNAKELVLGNTCDIEFTLHNGDGKNFQPPKFTQFKVLSGPNTSNSMQIINGNVTKSMTYSYMLQAKATGTFTIPPATIVVKGKKIKTNALRIKVVKGKQSTATTQAELDSELGEKVYVKAEVNTTKARIGQQVVVDYKLYTKVDINNYDIKTESEYDGFYPQNVRQYDGRVLKEVVDGNQFTTKVLKRVALFPQQAGLLTIDPMTIVLGIKDPNAPKPRGFFSRPRSKPFRVETEPVKISVNQLPPNPPETFTGAVGKYGLGSSLNKTSVTTDDAFSLYMSLSGNGDMKRLQPAKLIVPESFEVYEPRVIEENSLEENGQLTGRKVWEYLVLPKKAGSFTFKPAFSYFDTDSLKYITLAPETFQIFVRKGSDKNVASKTPTTVQEDIRFIKTETNLKTKSGKFFGSIPFWVLSVLPFLLLGGVLFKQRLDAKRNDVDPEILRSRRAEKIARKRLSKAKEYLEQNKSKAFYEEVAQAMFGYTSNKLNIPLAELTKNNVKEKLQSLKVSEANIESFLKINRTCETALYAGMDNTAAMSETYENTISVIANIEEELEQKAEVS